MTDSPQPVSQSSSRRALLAGALGGLGALVASAIGRPPAAQAGSDGDVVLGATNLTSTVTQITMITADVQAFRANASGGGVGISGESSSAAGVYGTSSSGAGVYGTSSSQSGVYGASGSGNGVHGESSSSAGVVGTSPTIGVSGTSTTGSGVYGSSGSGVGVNASSNATSAAAARAWSAGNSTGLVAYSGDNPPAALANTGLYGMATQDDTARGVVGETTGGHGVHGIATSGYAGYFVGKVFTNKFHEMAKTTTPTAPAANKARLFVRDNGSGKTQLCVRFPTGAVQVIKTEL